MRLNIPLNYSHQNLFYLIEQSISVMGPTSLGFHYRLFVVWYQSSTNGHEQHQDFN